MKKPKLGNQQKSFVHVQEYVHVHVLVNEQEQVDYKLAVFFNASGDGIY